MGLFWTAEEVFECFRFSYSSHQINECKHSSAANSRTFFETIHNLIFIQLVPSQCCQYLLNLVIRLHLATSYFYDCLSESKSLKGCFSSPAAHSKCCIYYFYSCRHIANWCHSPNPDSLSQPNQISYQQIFPQDKEKNYFYIN